MRSRSRTRPRTERLNGWGELHYPGIARVIDKATARESTATPDGCAWKAEGGLWMMEGLVHPCGERTLRSPSVLAASSAPR